MAEIDTFDSLFFCFGKIYAYFMKDGAEAVYHCVASPVLKEIFSFISECVNVFSGREVCGQVSSSPGHCLDGIMLLNQFIRIPD